MTHNLNRAAGFAALGFAVAARTAQNRNLLPGFAFFLLHGGYFQLQKTQQRKIHALQGQGCRVMQATQKRVQGKYRD